MGQVLSSEEQKEGQKEILEKTVSEVQTVNLTVFEAVDNISGRGSEESEVEAVDCTEPPAKVSMLFGNFNSNDHD